MTDEPTQRLSSEEIAALKFAAHRPNTELRHRWLVAERRSSGPGWYMHDGDHATLHEARAYVEALIDLTPTGRSAASREPRRVVLSSSHARQASAPRCQANTMSAYLAHLRGGPRHGQTVEIAQPAFCVLVPEHDGEAVYEVCAPGDFGELIYRYSHTDRGEPLDEPGPCDDVM